MGSSFPSGHRLSVSVVGKKQQLLDYRRVRQQIIGIMTARRIRHLPVMEGEAVEGVLSAVL
jgi:CBS domain-containing protein